MLFNEKFIDSIDNNPVEAIVEACKTLEAFLLPFQGNKTWSQEEHDAFLEAAALIDIITENYGITCDFLAPEPSTNIQNDCSLFKKYIGNVKGSFLGQATELKIESYKNRFQTALKSSFAYEFSQGDLNRIQVLVNELRTHITESISLEPVHKRRLLKRLEKLQSELHKRVSDLDMFWGMVGDAGVVIGKLGTDAKPIVDRIREISEIVWRTQARTEELSSDFLNPLIEDYEPNNNGTEKDGE